jgi:hypothetical protein
MKFKGQGGMAMVLGIFIGGIFLGFSVGFATMALVAARGLRLQSEEAPGSESHLSWTYSPTRNFKPSLGARPQTSGAWFIAGP